MNEALARIEQVRIQSRRDLLKKLLDQCTPGQQTFFGKLYPEGIDKMEDSKIDTAVSQCTFTIKKNNKEKTNG